MACKYAMLHMALWPQQLMNPKLAEVVRQLKALQSECNAEGNAAVHRPGTEITEAHEQSMREWLSVETAIGEAVALAMQFNG